MNKFNYIKILNGKKIRYLSNYYEKNLYIVFLHGFMSNLEGDKPSAFYKYCKKKKLGFLGLEYSGHGKSSGQFLKGNISKWTNEVKITIKKIIKKNDFILVGSSMGAWISLNQFKYFKKQIKGFVGIGSAPEFLEKLIWKQFTKKMKEEIKKKGVSIIMYGSSKSSKGQHQYPITYQLMKDGEKNKVLLKKINSKIYVTVIHGKQDELVPVSFSKKVLSIFPYAQKKLVVIRNGDHSLSNKNTLKKIIKELDSIVKNII